MSAERLLVVALAIVSTLAAGLAADARGPSPIARARLLALVAANVLALPLVAYGLARAAGVDGAVGVVLAAAAPGGSTGPLLAVVSRGDAAAAALGFVVLTLAGMVAALVATLALDAAGVGAIALASLVVAVTSIGPLLIGLAVRARRPAGAAVAQRWLARLSLALLVATIAVLAARHHAAATLGAVGVGAAVTGLALLAGAVARGRAVRIAVAQVSAVRNLTLVLLVLAVVAAPPRESMAALAYGLAMYGVTIGAALVWRARRSA